MARKKQSDFSSKEWGEKFEVFWKVYPLREGAKDGKTAAKRIWMKIEKSKTNFDKIMTALDDYRARPECRQGNKYVALAKNWLEQKRYDDTSETSQKPLDIESEQEQNVVPTPTENNVTHESVPATGSLRQRYLAHAGILTGD